MFEIKHSAAKGKWKKPSNVASYYCPEKLDIQCPNPDCNCDLVNSPPINWDYKKLFFWSSLTCSRCGEKCLVFLTDPQREESLIERSNLFLYPIPKPQSPFPIDPKAIEQLKEVSPTFLKLLEQTAIAEHSGLDELVGMGYRKALEFLLKDYLISQKPREKKEISSSFLGICIKNYIDDSRIKECAKRAVWLGNDETHYSRKWEDRDINDLKTLMELTLHWISMEFLTKKYKDGMPSPEKRKDE